MNRKKILWVPAVLAILIASVAFFYFYADPLGQNPVNTNQTASNNAGAQASPVVSESTLPGDIHPAQVSKIVEGQYAIVQKPSSHFVLMEVRSSTQYSSYSGILEWDASTNKWKKLLEVTDANPSVSMDNNPIDLVITREGDADQIMHLTIMDTSGAGSGEGYAKKFVAENLLLDSWRLENCYYNALDLGKQDITPTPSTAQCSAVKITLVR